MTKMWMWTILLAAGIINSGCGTVAVDSIHPMVSETSVGQMKKW